MHCLQDRVSSRSRMFARHSVIVVVKMSFEWYFIFVFDIQCSRQQWPAANSIHIFIECPHSLLYTYVCSFATTSGVKTWSELALFTPFKSPRLERIL